MPIELHSPAQLHVVELASPPAFRHRIRLHLVQLLMLATYLCCDVKHSRQDNQHQSCAKRQQCGDLSGHPASHHDAACQRDEHVARGAQLFALHSLVPFRRACSADMISLAAASMIRSILFAYSSGVRSGRVILVLFRTVRFFELGAKKIRGNVRRFNVQQVRLDDPLNVRCGERALALQSGVQLAG